MPSGRPRRASKPPRPILAGMIPLGTRRPRPSRSSPCMARRCRGRRAPGGIAGHRCHGRGGRAAGADLHGEPATLDPAAAGDAGSAAVIAQLFEGLTAMDPTLTPRPALAERWELRDDGRTVLFTLRDGLTFSDGTPLTAADVRRKLAPRHRPGRALTLGVAPVRRGGRAGVRGGQRQRGRRRAPRRRADPRGPPDPPGGRLPRDRRQPEPRRRPATRRERSGRAASRERLRGLRGIPAGRGGIGRADAEGQLAVLGRPARHRRRHPRVEHRRAQPGGRLHGRRAGLGARGTVRRVVAGLRSGPGGRACASRPTCP